MFDFGLQSIASLIKNKSQNSLADLVTKLKPGSHSEEKDQKTPPTTRTSSRLDTQTHAQPKNLEQRKKKLMKQLQTVDDQLRRAKIQQSRIEGRNKSLNNYNDPEALSKAADLVARMNQKRKQQSVAQRKKNEKMELRMQSSLKKIKQLAEKQQKQKQQKRIQIQERIMKRRQHIQVLNEFSKKSDSLINELQSYRISLPNITKFKNPEQIESSFDKIIKKKVKNESPKTLPKSPFLQRIQQDEMNAKREQYIKSYEKKKIRERQQLYGRKIRKNLKQSSLFVTE